MVSPLIRHYRWLGEMAQGYRAARVLQTAVRLGVFAQLRGRWFPAREALRRLRLPTRSGTMLLDACAALGLLRKRRHRYRNSPAAEQWLIPGGPNDLTPGLRLAEEGYATWGELAACVQRNRPVHDRFRDPTLSAESFTLAMASWNRPAALQLAETVDLRRRYRLLDVGGGSGVHALAFVQRYPWLQVTLLDRPPVCATTRRLLAGQPGAARIHLLPGDYHDELPTGFDGVLLSHIVHAESPREAQRLLQRAVKALEPGGLLIVVDFLAEASRTRPVFPALFALTMLLETARGQVYTAREVSRWVRQAGGRRLRHGILHGTWAHWLSAVKRG